MSSLTLRFKKTKRKYENFKIDERGGDIINQILMLVVALLIIGLILFFALVQFEKVKNKTEEVFGIDLPELNSTQDSRFMKECNFVPYDNYKSSNEYLCKNFIGNDGYFDETFSKSSNIVFFTSSEFKVYACIIK